MTLYGEDLSSLNLYSSASKITVFVRLTTSLSICASEWLTTKTPFLLTMMSQLRQYQIHIDLFLLNYLKKIDRKSTRLNSSHVSISYAVFCLKKKNRTTITTF